MTNPFPTTRCRAKQRSTCRWHGAEDRLAVAIKRNSAGDFFDAAAELEALRASNWQEGGWGFMRPANRPVESLADIEELLASKSVLADAYTASFEYGYAMRSAVVRRSAKRRGIFYREAKIAGGVQFDFTAVSKQDLRFLKELLEHNQRMLAEDNAQVAYVTDRLYGTAAS